jgi:hypothetical protein
MAREKQITKYMEEPYIPFYKPYGMTDEEYSYEVRLAEQRHAEWEDKIEITKTDLALVVKCKCGGTVAATLIYGGISIDEEFTDTMAKVYNDGGKLEIVKPKVAIRITNFQLKTNV